MLALKTRRKYVKNVRVNRNLKKQKKLPWPKVAVGFQ